MLALRLVIDTTFPSCQTAGISSMLFLGEHNAYAIR